MDNSIAYQIGEVLGALLVVAIVIGVLVLFIIALVKSIKTARKGWIITAAISGIPIAAFLVLFLIGMALNITRGGASSPIFGGSSGSVSDLLTASMTPVPGSAIGYQISYPMIDSWKKLDPSNGAFDQLYNFHDAYVGVIAEGIGVGTPQRICDLSQKNLTDKASQYSFTSPQPIQIDSHPWLTYDATATVSGVDLKYRFYVYADANYTFQIISWTGPGAFDKVNPVFDRVAQSFKLPK